MGLSGVLFVVFLVLKLTGQIDWSWWWVTAPLWGTIALVFIVVFSVSVWRDLEVPSDAWPVPAPGPITGEPGGGSGGREPSPHRVSPQPRTKARRPNE